MTDINIGAITETLNNKADIDAQNLDATGKSYVAGLSFPSNKYVDSTLGANGATYTAPADGYIYFVCDSGTGVSFIILAQPPIADEVLYSAKYTDVHKVFHVRKGNFIVHYSNVTVKTFRFVYARGDV